MSHVKIVDSIMGSGKTSAAINLMNKTKEDSYIFITPYLKEIERIKSSCINRRFYDPINKGNGKLDSLHELLQQNKNIASTHALFQKSNNVTKELIRLGNYTLILDEVFNVIEELSLGKDDLPTLFNEQLVYEDNGYLLWNSDRLDYDGQYNDIKNMCINRNLMMYQGKVLMWVFPVEIFKAFKEVYIMTYLFDAQEQKYYYDLNNLEYQYYIASKENNEYIFKPRNNYSDIDIKRELANKINIIEDNINDIGEDKFSLSATWFKNKDNFPLIKRLNKNIYNYFRNKTKSKSKEIMWTTFKNAKTKLSGKGYTKGFVACNARATNDFVNRNNLAYCINVFQNPIIKQFFAIKNITINEQQYALSEMLQWIWRSAIREDKPINIYIPSKRMRTLLINWLNNTY